MCCHNVGDKWYPFLRSGKRFRASRHIPGRSSHTYPFRRYLLFWSTGWKGIRLYSGCRIRNPSPFVWSGKRLSFLPFYQVFQIRCAESDAAWQHLTFLKRQVYSTYEKWRKTHYFQTVCARPKGLYIRKGVLSCITEKVSQILSFHSALLQHALLLWTVFWAASLCPISVLGTKHSSLRRCLDYWLPWPAS